MKKIRIQNHGQIVVEGLIALAGILLTIITTLYIFNQTSEVSYAYRVDRKEHDERKRKSSPLNKKQKTEHSRVNTDVFSIRGLDDGL